MYYFLCRHGWNYWKSDKYLQWDCSQNGTAHNLLINWLTFSVKNLVIKGLFGFFLFTVAELSRSTIGLSSHSLKKKEKKKEHGIDFLRVHLYVSVWVREVLICHYIWWVWTSFSWQVIWAFNLQKTFKHDTCSRVERIKPFE